MAFTDPIGAAFGEAMIERDYDFLVIDVVEFGVEALDVIDGH